MKILIVSEHYLPGVKAGGPIQSISNFVNYFKDLHQICIYTRDRDLGDNQAFAGITANEWTAVSAIPVYYASPTNCNSKSLRAVLASVKPDVIYLNSMMSKLSRTVFLDLIRLRHRKSLVLLAVRGELNPAALQIKPIRKWIFLKVMRILRLENFLTFQASSAKEELAIRSIFPNAKVVTAGPIPKKPILVPRRVIAQDSVSFVFAARISKMKNLRFLLERMLTLRNLNWKLKIFGPVEDVHYWQECLEIMHKLEDRVEYCGQFRQEQIWEIYGNADFMLLPTLGENFGHSIYESAAAGTPFLISDRTPWDSRACGLAGKVIPLESPEQWEAELRNCIECEPFHIEAMRESCITLAASVWSEAVKANRTMLDELEEVN